MTMAVRINDVFNAILVKGNNRFNCKGTYTVGLAEGMVLADGKSEFSFTVNGEGPFVYKKTIK